MYTQTSVKKKGSPEDGCAFLEIPNPYKVTWAYATSLTAEKVRGAS